MDIIFKGGLSTFLLGFVYYLHAITWNEKLNVSYLVFILPMVVLRYTDLLDANLYLLTKMYFFAILTDINVFLRHLFTKIFFQLPQPPVYLFDIMLLYKDIFSTCQHCISSKSFYFTKIYFSTFFSTANVFLLGYSIYKDIFSTFSTAALHFMVCHAETVCHAWQDYVCHTRPGLAWRNFCSFEFWPFWTVITGLSQAPNHVLPSWHGFVMRTRLTIPGAYLFSVVFLSYLNSSHPTPPNNKNVQGQNFSFVSPGPWRKF